MGVGEPQPSLACGGADRSVYTVPYILIAGRGRPLTTLLVLVGLAALLSCGGASPQPGMVRVGWQTPWATQGQVVQVLKHTNALELHGLKAEYKGFNYGGPLNEAALAGEVDVIFTADQPAATLLARGSKWTIVARLMYNRVAIYVPPDSDIRSVVELKGKRVAMPFGAAAQRVALKAMQDAGLDPDKDVTSVNLDIYEQNNIVQAGDRRSWGSIDALVGFDPTPAIFESKGLARMLYVGRVVSLVLMSDDYLRKHPDESTRFLQAFIRSWHYYATHQAQANDWFLQESRLQFDPSVLDTAAAVEPNIKARAVGDIRATLNQEDIDTMEAAARFLHDGRMAPVLVKMSEHYDPAYVNAAQQQIVGADDAVELRVVNEAAGRGRD